MYKTVKMVLAILSLMVLPLAAQMHGGGHGNGGNGNGGGGQCYNITEGTPFAFDGTVISVGTRYSQVVASTSTGNLTVTGLGSNRYWDSLDMTKPVVGDSISGKGYAVSYNDVVRNILTDITVNGTLVPLRDENGKPLWRGRNGGGRGHGGGGGNVGPRCNLLEGTPFNHQGDVIDSYVRAHGIHGNGLVIATASGNVSVSGMGPNYFWEKNGVTKPVVGDTITTTGYAVETNGNTVNVTMSVVLESGVTLQLRDTETGTPLWRNRRK
ncbi:MAG: hypothetical protein GY765_34795 [bacterium]|nr:hypothetical protein [bacterium]